MKSSELIKFIENNIPVDAPREYILTTFNNYLPDSWRKLVDWDMETPVHAEKPSSEQWISKLHITDWPIWRYICSVHTGEVSEKIRNNRLVWMAINLLVVYKLQELDHKSAHIAVPMPFRLACRGKRFYNLYVDLLPPDKPENLAKTVKNYLAWKLTDISPYALSDNDRRQLEQLRQRYQSFEQSRQGLSRRHGIPQFFRSTGQRGRTLSEEPRFVEHKFGDSELTILVDDPDAALQARGIDHDEYQNDQPTPDMTVVDQTDRLSAKTSLTRQQRVARGKVRALRRRDMQLPTDSRALNLAMMQAICTEMQSQMTDNAASDRTQVLAAVVLTSVFTATQPAQWLPLIVRGEHPPALDLRRGSDVYWVVRELEIGKSKNWDTIGADLFRNSDIRVELPLPINWMLTLEGIRGVYLTETDVDLYLKQIEGDLGINGITQQRLQRGLHGVIKRHLNGGPLADIISGIPPQHSPALYYISESCEALRAVMIKAQRLLTSDRVSVPDSAMSASTGRIGSLRAPSNSIITEFMNRMCQSIRVTADYNTRIHYYTIWLWHYALLMTGCRPVSGAPGALSDIDEKLKIITLSDKENRLNVSAQRVVPVTDQFLRVVDVYRELCRTVYDMSRMTQVFSAGCENLIDREKPMLQFFQNKWQPMTRKTMNQLVTNSWPYEANWHRHAFRGILSELGAAPDALNAVMGHEQPDQEWLNPYSGVAMRDYDDIRSLIDKMSVDVLQLEMPY